jgi:hypothetical protein
MKRFIEKLLRYQTRGVFSGHKKSMQRQSLFGAAFVFFLPVTQRFFPASRSRSVWNGGLSRRVISWK